MSNTFSAYLMPRILAGALKVLREECAILKLVKKDFEASAARIGQQVSVSVPYAMSTYSITPAAVPPALVDATIYHKLITIDQWYGTRFHFTPKDSAEYDFANSEFVPRQVAESARVIARQINQYLHGKYTQIPGFAGTVASRAFASNIDVLADVRKRLNYQLCPDTERVCIVGLNDEKDALKLDDVKRNPQMAGDRDAMRLGKLGMLYGMDTYRDRDVKTHTPGTGITGTVTVHAATAKGASTVVIDTGVGETVDLAVGDVVTFSGGTGDSDIFYAVQTAVTMAANGSDSVVIDRPLETALTTSDAISLPAGQGAGTVNIAGDLGGLGLVMRIPESSIEGAPTIGPSLTMQDDLTGAPLKLSYLPGYHAAQWELSTLYGAAVIDQRRLVRLWSKT